MRSRHLVLVLAVGLSWTAAIVNSEPAAAHRFADESSGSPGGNGPLAQVKAAAARYGNRSECGLTPNKLTALMLPMTWAETAGKDVTLTPHPMTMGRADTYRDSRGNIRRKGGNKRLYWENQTTASGRVFWHAGLGMWQIDDSGLGSQLATGKYRPYNTVAGHLAQRWCDTGELNAVFAPWIACRGNWCRDVFNQIYVAATDALQHLDHDTNTLVNYWAGIEARTCRIKSQKFPCYYIDPAKADPDARIGTWTYSPNGSSDERPPSPLTMPHYVYTVPDGDSYLEYRVWLDADLPDKAFDVKAVRRFGQDSRAPEGASGGLTWERGSNLCDVTKSRGRC